MKNSIKITFLVFVVQIITVASSFAQCAMCRSAVESTMSNGRNNSAIGLNTGILYLLIAPYLLVCVVGYLWYKTSLKQSKARALLSKQVRQAMSN